MAENRSKRKYTPEFRQGAVRLVLKEGRTTKQAAADLGMPENTLVAWLHQARRGKGSFTPPEEVDLQKRVRELEAENRRLKPERDILKKATAFFARENEGQP